MTKVILENRAWQGVRLEQISPAIDGTKEINDVMEFVKYRFAISYHFPRHCFYVCEYYHINDTYYGDDTFFGPDVASCVNWIAETHKVQVEIKDEEKLAEQEAYTISKGKGTVVQKL